MTDKPAAPAPDAGKIFDLLQEWLGLWGCKGETKARAAFRAAVEKVCRDRDTWQREADLDADDAIFQKERAERAEQNLKSARLKHKEDAAQIVDLLHEKERAKQERAIAESFHKVAVKERDYERARALCAEQEAAALKALLKEARPKCIQLIEMVKDAAANKVTMTTAVTAFWAVTDWIARIDAATKEGK